MPLVLLALKLACSMVKWDMLFTGDEWKEGCVSPGVVPPLDVTGDKLCDAVVVVMG